MFRRSKEAQHSIGQKQQQHDEEGRQHQILSETAHADRGLLKYLVYTCCSANAASSRLASDPSYREAKGGASNYSFITNAL